MYIYICLYIKNKTFITQQVIFRFLSNLRRLIESSKVWRKPKCNSLNNKCLIFDVYIDIEN